MMMRLAPTTCLLLVLAISSHMVIAAENDGSSGNEQSADASTTPSEPSPTEKLVAGGESFIAWLETNGVDVSGLGLVLGAEGLQASARQQHDVGAKIIMPPHIVLNRATASALSPKLAEAYKATAERGLSLPTDVSTVVALMFETFHNPSSFWQPYLELLPLKQQHPFFYTETEIALAATVPAVKHRISEMREMLLGNFQVLFDNMLKHHPEVFGDSIDANGEPITQAFDSLRSQFAWATAVVAMRGMLSTTASGAEQISLVPYLDMMVYEYRTEPTVVTEVLDEGTTFGTVLADPIASGGIFKITPDLKLRHCNFDMLLLRGQLINSTTWDCAFIWHALPTRPEAAPASVPSMVWALHRDLGYIAQDVFDGPARDATVEVVHTLGEPVSDKFLALSRLAVLSASDFGFVQNVLNGQRATLDAEHRAIRTAIKSLNQQKVAIQTAVQKLVDDGLFSHDESTWSNVETLLAVAIAGSLQAYDAAAESLQQVWLSALNDQPPMQAEGVTTTTQPNQEATEQPPQDA